MSTNIWNKQSYAWRIHCQICVQWSIHYYQVAYKRCQGKENQDLLFVKNTWKKKKKKIANLYRQTGQRTY